LKEAKNKRQKEKIKKERIELKEEEENPQSWIEKYK